VVNTPARGIGKSSVDKLLRWCDAAQMPPLDAARSAAQVSSLNKRAQSALHEFAVLIDELGRKATGPVAELLADVLARTGYLQIGPESSEEELQRRANVEELVSAARQYDEQEGDAGSLGGFLESATLAQDVDALNSDLGAVTLMTLHAAKGLEFPCVYIIGVEQNLIPHERAVRQYDQNQLEEERRLLFVGLTRAKERLVLTHTTRREMHGRSLSTIPSDFLSEMPLTWDDRTQGPLDAEVFDIDIDEVAAPAPHSRKPRDRHPWASSTARLTTGAALATGSNHAVDPPLGFTVGMTVRHPRYGLGTVIEVSPGMSRHRTLTVQFEDDRQETFVAAKCPLQPVGIR
jgi:DNA helicase-2/ATP-dependent DNA helicase PcrA